MPRPSLNPDKAKQGGGGVEAGNYEVSSAKFQNIKTDFRPNQLYLVLDSAVLDKDGDRVRGADAVSINLSFGEKSLEAFHPGKGTGPDDADPKDLGDEVDVEGNTIYCVESEAFNKSCGALVFMESLVKAGFPKATLDQSWAPSLAGLKFALATLSPKECNDRFGTRLNTKPMIDQKTQTPAAITYKVVDKWLNPNYLTAGGKKGKDGVAADTTKEESTAAEPASLEDIVKEVLALVASKKSGDKNKIKSKQALIGFFTNEYTKSKQNPKKLAEAQALIKDDEWIADAVAELGGSYDDGVTIFPEAD